MAGEVPLTSVGVECDGLTLRSPLDDDIDAFMAVYDDDFNLEPQPRPATDPDTARERILRRIGSKRHPKRRNDWHLELIAETKPGHIVGWATLYPGTGSTYELLETSSWVTPTLRGRGHATTIRQGLLALAFDGLGAEFAISRAQPGNHSNRISCHLGYKQGPPPSTDSGYQLWTLSRQAWDDSKPHGIALDGYQPFRDWLTKT